MMFNSSALTPTSLLRVGLGSIGRLWWTDPELLIPLRAPAKSSMSTAICSQTPAQPKQPRVYSDSSTPFHRSDALFHGIWRVPSAPNRFTTNNLDVAAVVDRRGRSHRLRLQFAAFEENCSGAFHFIQRAIDVARLQFNSATAVQDDVRL